MAVALHEIESKVSVLECEVCFDDTKPLCKMLNLSKTPLTDSLLNAFYRIICALNIRAGESLSSRGQDCVLRLFLSVSRLLKQCELTQHATLQIPMKSLVETIVCNTHFSISQRDAVLIEALLVCKYDLSKRFIRDIETSWRMRHQLPCTPCVVLFAMHTPNVPVVRHTLFKLGTEQWDMTHFMDYLGKDLVLEIANLKKSYSCIPNSFKFTTLDYEWWPLYLLNGMLNRKDFLLTCFAISEGLYTSTCFNMERRQTRAVSTDLSNYVANIDHEEPSWYECVSNWEQKASLRYMLYVKCIKLHFNRGVGMHHVVAHRELRTRRIQATL